jgi:tRNA-binding protein
MQTIDYKEFDKIELRVGTIIRSEIFEEARKPAYKIWIDLGEEIGVKKSSAQITFHYTLEELIGRQVICVCNFSPRQIANFMSEVLITGFLAEEGGVILAGVDKNVPNGSKLH